MYQIVNDIWMSNDQKMHPVGIEPTPPKRSRPKRDALDHSAKDACWRLTQIDSSVLKSWSLNSGACERESGATSSRCAKVAISNKRCIPQAIQKRVTQPIRKAHAHQVTLQVHITQACMWPRPQGHILHCVDLWLLCAIEVIIAIKAFQRYSAAVTEIFKQKQCASLLEQLPKSFKASSISHCYCLIWSLSYSLYR
jgi:hypothetical protein